MGDIGADIDILVGISGKPGIEYEKGILVRLRHGMLGAVFQMCLSEVWP